MPQDSPRSSNQRTAAARGEEAPAAVAAAVADASSTRLVEIGLKNVKTGLRLHQEIFDAYHGIGRDWLERAASDAELALKLPNKIGNARSVPDALAAYHEWLSEWVRACEEDGRRFLVDGQKIIQTSARCFANSRSASSAAPR